MVAGTSFLFFISFLTDFHIDTAETMVVPHLVDLVPVRQVVEDAKHDVEELDDGLAVDDLGNKVIVLIIPS